MIWAVKGWAADMTKTGGTQSAPGLFSNPREILPDETMLGTIVPYEEKGPGDHTGHDCLGINSVQYFGWEIQSVDEIEWKNNQAAEG